MTATNDKMPIKQLKYGIEKAGTISWKSYVLFSLIVLLTGCTNKEQETSATSLFKVLDSKATGIDFRNDLSYNKEFNLFKYIYFYNGSGVGAGDFNNDGLIDLFFGSNQQRNNLYLNTGSFNLKM